MIGIFSKSQGLVADGIHTLSDLVADFIVLVANRHSQKHLTMHIHMAIFVLKMQHLYTWSDLLFIVGVSGML